MLKLLEIILPTIFRNQFGNIFKYFKIALIVLFIAFTSFAMYKTYNIITEQFAEMKTNKELIIKQAAIIEKQAKYIEDLTKQMQNLQESHNATLKVIQDLYEEKKKVDEVTVKRKKKVDSGISNINSKPIPEDDKVKERSALLIDDLNGTYCELFPTNCINTGKTP